MVACRQAGGLGQGLVVRKGSCCSAWHYRVADMDRTLRFAMAFAVSATAAMAEDQCAIVNAIESENVAVEGVTCQTYRDTSGAMAASCHWHFGFRDKAAVSFADRVWRSLKECRSGTAQGSDQQVNHPDSYALRTWVSGRRAYFVSVKDKGQLDQTLVFLRRESDSGE